MPFVVSLEDFQPGARYDGLPWTQARIEQGTSATGPWTALQTLALSPLDANPALPASRDFTTTLATSATGWFRIVFLDAAAREQPTGSVYVNPNVFQGRGESVATLLTQIRDEAGFDVTETQALRWLNARHRKMIARSRCLRATLSVGTTVADTGSYPLNTDVVAVYQVQVGGTAYSRIGRDDAAASGRLLISNSFYANADGSGTIELTLYPAPTEAGAAITAFAAILPPDLDADDYPLVPIDFQDALVEGAIATGMARDIEQVGIADRFEDRFDRACEELRRRTNSQVAGGSVQMRVVGVNAV